METAFEREKERSAKRTASLRLRHSASAASHPILRLQQQAGNQAVQMLLRRGFIQAKLMVSSPASPEEQEADRVADHVMRARGGYPASSPCSCQDGQQCEACAQTGPAIQRHVESGRAAQESAVEGTSLPAMLRPEGGQLLDSATRAFFEPRFARDFGDVRVHTAGQAAKSAQAIDAAAYTFGQHIVFNQNQYQPGTIAGKRLLAHELTHVSQSSPSQRRDVAHRQPTGPASPPAAPPVPTTTFHPGVNHAHAPSGRWADVQANPNSGFWENRACANFAPSTVVGLAIQQEFSDKPLALEHLNWYLGNGGGADFVEDANLNRMLRTDTGVQALLARVIPSGGGGSFTGHVKVEQSDYQNQDFRFAFGAIDRLDFEVNFAAQTLHAWFQDRYEWHPVYPGLYVHKPGDEVRDTNCVHAALVELKSGGAADFWMKGETTVPLSVVRAGTGPSTPAPNAE